MSRAACLLWQQACHTIMAGEMIMSLATQKNFHVPLPDETYRKLRAEAERARQPATTLAREAIEAWLEERRAAAIHAELAAYAAKHAGTEVDLDKNLEAAGLELWRDELEEVPQPKTRKRGLK
jgi:predicted DNA-binding protein